MVSAYRYLDYNAAAPLRPEAAAAMAEAASRPRNPSSGHRYGREGRMIVERARAALAEAVSCFPGEVIFTSCGTEANALALRSFAGHPVYAAATEHVSVLGNAPDATLLPVGRDGVLPLEALDRALAALPPALPPPLVSVMLAHNETGVIQPIGEIAALVHARGGLLHCDAAQALGKIPVDSGVLGADMLTLSAHKMGGPQGAGALVVRGEIALQPLFAGGSQEKRRRPGTENVAAIAGFAEAASATTGDRWQEGVRAALAAMERAMLAALPQAEILGRDAPRLPHVSAVRMPGVSAETQLMHFDLEGFAVSAGAACSSGRVEPSHVARAMGMERSAAGEVIRISAGWATDPGEIEAFAGVWAALAARLAV